MTAEKQNKDGYRLELFARLSGTDLKWAYVFFLLLRPVFLYQMVDRSYYFKPRAGGRKKILLFFKYWSTLSFTNSNLINFCQPTNLKKITLLVHYILTARGVGTEQHIQRFSSVILTINIKTVNTLA